MKKNIIDSIRRSECAVSMALDAVGDKWSLLILRDLMFSDKRTYGELQASEERIATNILASRLVTLEANNLIRKKADPADSRRILYFLTEKGIHLVPVVIELMQWMSKFNPEASACTGNTKAYKKDRVGLYKEIIADLKKLHEVKSGKV
ncbi:MAG: helix-turn-helix domain-containing protein [Ferruginibacter sp.]